MEEFWPLSIKHRSSFVKNPIYAAKGLWGEQRAVSIGRLEKPRGFCGGVIHWLSRRGENRDGAAAGIF